MIVLLVTIAAARLGEMVPAANGETTPVSGIRVLPGAVTATGGDWVKGRTAAGGTGILTVHVAMRTVTIPLEAPLGSQEAPKTAVSVVRRVEELIVGIAEVGAGPAGRQPVMRGSTVDTATESAMLSAGTVMVVPAITLAPVRMDGVSQIAVENGVVVIELREVAPVEALSEVIPLTGAEEMTAVDGVNGEMTKSGPFVVTGGGMTGMPGPGTTCGIVTTVAVSGIPGAAVAVGEATVKPAVTIGVSGIAVIAVAFRVPTRDAKYGGMIVSLTAIVMTAVVDGETGAVNRSGTPPLVTIGGVSGVIIVVAMTAGVTKTITAATTAIGTVASTNRSVHCLPGWSPRITNPSFLSATTNLSFLRVYAPS